MIIQILLCLFITYGICWVLHLFSEYIDFDLPQIQEKRYKDTLRKKYGINHESPSVLIGLPQKSQALLKTKARAYADNMMKKLHATSSAEWHYHYNWYIDKYKIRF